MVNNSISFMGKNLIFDMLYYLFYSNFIIFFFFDRLCSRKAWFDNRLILALPEGYRVKDNVVIKTYKKAVRVQPVFDWVNRNLAARVKDIRTLKELNNDWLTFSGTRREEKVKVVLFSKLQFRPMFYSVLSAKFSGRVQFGHVNVRTLQGRMIVDRLHLKRIPTYMIITPEMNHTYGTKPGEYLNYNSMALYLRSYHPEVNDIFLLSLVIVNLSCWLELFIVQGTIFRRLGRLLWCIGKWNCMLILLWLPLLGLIQLPFIDKTLAYILWALRLVSSSDTACLLRADWLWLSSLHFSVIFITFLVYALIVGYVHYKFIPERPEADNNNNTASFWESNWDSYLAPATLTRPWMPRDLDMEVGIELLIERLAVISTDYIKQLPVWKYTGLNYDSDVCSDGDGARSESDPEDHSNIGKQPLMFMCEKCRALQNKDNKKSAAEQMRENAESEMACAKFLMDGDYKCQCHLDSGQGHGHTRGRSRSPRHSRFKQKKESAEKDDDTEGVPPGMLPTSECVVCLERYRYGVLLCGLPCGHSFHQNCIVNWLSRDNHCCPVCRWPPYKAKPCQMHLHIE